MNLENRVIIIMGGTSGIGWSAARYFRKCGARIFAVGLEDGSMVDDSDPSLQILYADATVENTIDRAIKLCLESFDAIHGLYHVAGGSGRRWGDGPLHSISTEAWHKTIQLNLTSVMFSNRGVIKYWLRKRQGGSILNLSSVLATEPSTRFATHAYAVSKAGVIGLSKSLATQYAHMGIRVNVLAPGLIETTMSQRALSDQVTMDYIGAKQPLRGSAGKVDDLDMAACYFMSDASSFVTGQILKIDGGWSVSEGHSVS